MDQRRSQGSATPVGIQSRGGARNDLGASCHHGAKRSMEGTMGSIRDEAYALASERVDRQGTFRSAYLDFDRGIRVGHLAVEERLTQIIKSRLTARYGVRMLCDRWGPF